MFPRTLPDSAMPRDVEVGKDGRNAVGPIVITCAADDGFAQPLAVMLYSALANYRGVAKIVVYIIDGGVSAANRLRIDAITRRGAAAVEWITPQSDGLCILRETVHFALSAYLRLLVPSLLPQWAEKAIYLDSDIIVDCDLSELWDCDVSDRALLAVQDEGIKVIGGPLGLANYGDLGLESTCKYFNSGVLLLNLRRWRERELGSRIISYIASHPNEARFAEQDAMNAVLSDDWGELESKWNQLVSPWKGHDGRQYRRGILHFVSSCKPWRPEGAHWTNYIYERYTRWSGWFGAIGWWAYYWPLMMRRQHVLRLRAQQAGP